MDALDFTIFVALCAAFQLFAESKATTEYIVRVTTRGSFQEGWPVVTLAGERGHNATLPPLHYTERDYNRSVAAGSVYVHALRPATFTHTNLGIIENVTVSLLDDVTKGRFFWFLDSNMPKRKKTSLSKKTANTECKRRAYQNETEAETSDRHQRNAACTATSRQNETETRTIERRGRDAASTSMARQNETESQTTERHERNAACTSESRQNETEIQTTERRKRNATCKSVSRQNETEAQTTERREHNTACTSASRQTETEIQTTERRKRNATCKSVSRQNETEAQTTERRERNTACTSASRQTESEIQTTERRKRNATCKSISRQNETEAQTTERHQRNAECTATSRQNETVPQTTTRRTRNATAMAISRQPQLMLEAAMKYKSDDDYQQDVYEIGRMTSKCGYCGSNNWPAERKGICCLNGKIRAPSTTPPDTLKSLLNGTHPDSKHYLDNIKAYNCAFQMTSYKATDVRERGGWNPTYKIQGQIYHRFGPINPQPGITPKCLQIYFVTSRDTQADIRMAEMPLNRHVMLELQDMLHTNNNYICSFKCAKDRAVGEDVKLVIRADKTPTGEHERRYNAPTTDEVGVLMTGDVCSTRDIVLEQHDNRLHFVRDTNRAYDALQYPLLFPYGEDGYNFKLKQSNPNTGEVTATKLSCLNFYQYKLMYRDLEFNTLLRCKNLAQQFVVDMYVKMESERLRYFSLNQKKLRAAEYIHLHDAVATDGQRRDVGRIVILPSSFTGGPRYMHEKTQDAMTYVRHYGCPDLFITVTCNPKWDEIKRELFPGQTPSDRQDLIARVFHLKLEKLMELMKKRQVFGPVRCHIYTVEWQKRGLPHCHILLWLKTKLKPEDIDKVICAEIPNKQDDPILHDIVKSSMIHGPCGDLNRSAPCMKDGICCKRYPKRLTPTTITGQDGYPQYRRRSPEKGGESVTIKMRHDQVTVNNAWVVPYNPFLSRVFDAHINVECCTSIRSIKYVCKYVNKGSDMAVFAIEFQGDTELDEVKLFQIGRYVSSSEAMWRLLGFLIHDHYPPVQHLQVHLENGQRVYFTEENLQQRAMVPPRTTLTAFFELCLSDDFAKTLMYNEVPRHYTLTAQKKWKRRVIGENVEGHDGVKKSDTLSRVYTVHPNYSECYYLRLLLHTVRGPTSFVDLKTVAGELCDSFRDACNKLGLLEDDGHWEHTLEEAALGSSPRQLRDLFALILHLCGVSSPLDLWMNHREDLSEDFLREDREFSEVIYNQALLYIDAKLLSFPNGFTGASHGLPAIDSENAAPLANELYRETHYDRNELHQVIAERSTSLTPDQHLAYSEILNVIDKNEGGLLFLDAPGGTGKTYLLNLILAKVRASNNIAIAVASSGIAATLLSGGRTAHSVFKLPLNLAFTDEPVCNISRGCTKAELLRRCQLIIWDECTMSNKKAFEALDRTLKDLKDNTKPMGGTTLLLSGDFRQTLPIVRKGTKSDEIDASLKSSRLWPLFRKLTLKTNMRAYLQGDVNAAQFASLLMDIGNGKIASISPDGYINVPVGCGQIVYHSLELDEKVYPNLSENYTNSAWLCERAILAPRNDTVSIINERLLALLPGEETVYHSVDSVPDIDQAVDYPVEFLNSLDISGMPPHDLKLKIGCPVMLLRNLDAPKLCNGTRLIITQLLSRVIEAKIAVGQFEGEHVFIPRIPLIPSDCPFEFKRVQFPLRTSFAMSINKSQGQSLKVAGLELGMPCFSHGQFYVGCSRVGSSDNLFICCEDGKTNNVVYLEALQ